MSLYKDKGTFLGLMGPSAIGKGFAFERLPDHLKIPYGFLPKVTTREPRLSDPEDGVIAVNDTQFDEMLPNLSGVHRPFNDERRYAFATSMVPDQLDQGRLVMGDPNLMILPQMINESPRLAEQGIFIGLVAPENYLDYNLSQRVLGEKGRISPEDEIDFETRIAAGRQTMKRIEQAANQGLIHEVVELNFANRTRFIPTLAKLLNRR